jgi:integrase
MSAVPVIAVPRPPSPLAIVAAGNPTIDEAVAAVFADLKPNTLKAYGETLDDFAAFIGAGSREAAARILFTCEHGQANLLALRYRTHLITDRGLAAKSVNTRLGCLAGIVKRCRRLGVVPWKLEVESLKSTPIRDTRGPGTKAIARMVEALEREDTPLNRRDAAIIELAFNPGLRRSEIAALDLDDIDLERQRIRLRRKGGDEDVWRTISPLTAKALCHWIRHRGDEPGPLFHNLDRVYSRRRLSTTSIYNLVQRAAATIGIVTHPHALRHAGGTAVAIATNGNILAVAEFLGHKNINVSKVYVDNLNDAAGDASMKVDELRGRL